MLFALALSLGALGGCSKGGAGGGSAAKDDVQIPNITVDDADKLLTAKQAIAVDCNGDNTRKKMGVIPGAIRVDDEETYAASALPADKNAKLVFYCGGPG